MTPDGRNMYVILEGAVIGDPKGAHDGSTSSTSAEVASPASCARARAELDTAGADAHFIADAQALDRHHLLVIEHDGGRGLAATFRTAVRGQPARRR